jgi:hypothetical protein
LKVIKNLKQPFILAGEVFRAVESGPTHPKKTKSQKS